jgi:hypothetical protein
MGANTTLMLRAIASPALQQSLTPLNRKKIEIGYLTGGNGLAQMKQTEFQEPPAVAEHKPTSKFSAIYKG